MPIGEIAIRYQTVGGAMTLVRGRHIHHSAGCTGCGEEASFLEDAKAWAQAHAETCRALPRLST